MIPGVAPETACTGVHVSIQGGVSTAITRGAALNCHAIQIFSHSSRTWAGPEIPDAEVVRFKTLHRTLGMGPILVHASYLINAATCDPDKRKKSRKALQEDWILSNRLGVSGLVLHPGSSAGQSVESAIARVGEMVREVLETPVAGRTRLLLENTAGGGKTLGRNPAELESLFKTIGHPSRTGLCLDSCHLYAAGFDISNETGYEKTLQDFCRVAPGGVSAWHLNDALFGLGSGRDRHTHLGIGYIGPWFFWKLLKDPRFRGCPMILETPKTDGEREDRLNLATLSILEQQPEFEGDSPSLRAGLSALASER